MYYPCSENKDADQLRGYREADLRLCFRPCKLLVFSRTGSFDIDVCFVKAKAQEIAHLILIKSILLVMIIHRNCSLTLKIYLSIFQYSLISSASALKCYD